MLYLYSKCDFVAKPTRLYFLHTLYFALRFFGLLAPLEIVHRSDSTEINFDDLGSW
jgi:hypothetical protein